jgi:hypothetical protein
LIQFTEGPFFLKEVLRFDFSVCRMLLSLLHAGSCYESLALAGEGVSELEFLKQPLSQLFFPF